MDKDWEGELILLSEKSKKTSQLCIILNMSNWYKYTFWLICCLHVYLGAVPDSEVLQVCSPCHHRWCFKPLPGIIFAQDVCYGGYLAVPVSFPMLAFIPKFFCCWQNVTFLSAVLCIAPLRQGVLLPQIITSTSPCSPTKEKGTQNPQSLRGEFLNRIIKEQAHFLV